MTSKICTGKCSERKWEHENNVDVGVDEEGDWRKDDKDPSRDDESLLGRRKWWHVKNYFGLTFNHDILGNTPIRDYVPDLDHNDIKSLKNKNIMFMDQLTTANGYFLFNWTTSKEITLTTTHAIFLNGSKTRRLLYPQQQTHPYTPYQRHNQYY